MAMNDSQKKRLENVWEALKHDKLAIISIAFLAIFLILSLLYFNSEPVAVFIIFSFVQRNFPLNFCSDTTS